MLINNSFPTVELLIIHFRLLIFFILLTPNYGYPQSINHGHLTQLIQDFEHELLYSHDKALALASEIEEASNIHTPKSEAILNYIKALRYWEIEVQADSAAKLVKKAYVIHGRLNDSIFLYKDLNLFYRCFIVSNQRDSAFYYATEGLKLAEAIKKPQLLAEANLNLGDAYYLTRQYDKVKQYRRRALAVAQKHNLKKELAKTHLKIGQSFLVLSEKRTKKVLDSAIYHCKKALSFAKEASYKYGIFDATVVLADLLNVNKQHADALNLIETITTLPINEVPLNYGYNAPFYHAVILKDNKRFEEAKSITHRLIKSTSKEDYRRKKALYYFLSVLYAYNNQPDSTDYSIKQAIIASNAQDVVKINASISALQTKYETKEKEQEIQILEQNKRLSELEIKELQQQRLILGYALLIPVLLIFAGGWFINRRRLKLQLETEQKEYEIKLSELKALRSQMNPHFIFNALNSIQEYIFSNEKKLASSYLVKFSRLIRTYLEHSQVLEIPISKEIEALELYLYLENNRMDNSIDYVIIVDDNLDTNQLFIPPLFLQPYVENAIKHGLLHKKGKKDLTISFNHDNTNNALNISVKDNGIGVAASKKLNKNKPYTSFATNANANRVRLMNFKRDKKIKVDIIDLKTFEYGNSGTEVIISIPI